MEESDTKDRDKVSQALANMDAHFDWIVKMTEHIQPISSALSTLGMRSGLKLYDHANEIRDAVMRLKDLRRQIIDARFAEAQQNSANVLGAALAGIGISKKKGE